MAYFRRKSSIPEQPSAARFQLSVVSVTQGGNDISKIKVHYGEIDGVPPEGLTPEEEELDYLIEPGNSYIYLIVTFDGNGRINSRTIGFDNPVPEDTDDQKHIVIGEVKYEDGQYTIISQNITQDIYPEKAVVVDRSNDAFVYSLFADPRKIHIINELEIFGVDVDGNGAVSKVYLADQDYRDYIEIKKSSFGSREEVSIYGYIVSAGENFILNAKEDESALTLFNGENSAYVKLKQSREETSLYGYVASAAEYFILQAKAEDTKLYLENGDGNATMGTKGLAFTDANNTRNSALSDMGLLIAKPNGQTTITESSITIEEQPNSGPNVYINIPTAGGSTVSATWKEIDVCVDGVEMKMQVLATDPYDDPTP
jgi:hypothetical protein